MAMHILNMVSSKVIPKTPYDLCLEHNQPLQLYECLLENMIYSPILDPRMTSCNFVRFLQKLEILASDNITETGRAMFTEDIDIGGSRYKRS